MLGHSQIAHYLLSIGLLKPRAVVEDGLTVVDASRRNCVFIATTRSGPTYVVKQAGPRSALTLKHEAEVLRMLADAPELVGQVPSVVHEDRVMALLVLSSPAGGRDWAELHNAGRFPLLPARALGRGLAAVHRNALDGVGDQPADVERMWALQFPEPSLDLIRDLSAGAQDLIARLQSNLAMLDRLSGLRDHDHKHVFVHGDLRWDNCVAVAPPGSRRRTQTLLVDWELAGRGESALDVGTVFAEYLSAWVGSIPIADVAAPGRFLSHAKYPLRRMRPAIDAFWSAYCTSSSTPPTLRRVLELAAVRLLQTAVERAQVVAAPTAHLVTLLQLAENVLLRTRERGSHAAGATSLSGYRDQLVAAVTAVTIRDRTRYDWLGHPSRPLPKPLRDELSALECRRHLVASLREELYSSFYSTGGPVPARWGRTQPVAADPWLTTALSDANAGSGSWEPGWIVDHYDGNEAIVATQRLRVRVSAADCRADDGGPIRPGVAVTVQLPKELPALSPGFFMVIGTAKFDVAASQGTLRAYWHINGFGGAGVGARTKLAPKRGERAVPAEDRRPPCSLRSLRRSGAVPAERGVSRAPRNACGRCDDSDIQSSAQDSRIHARARARRRPG